MSLRRRYLLSVSNKSDVNDGKNYFSIIALEDGLQVTFSSSGLKYKINNQSWETLNQNTYTVSVNAGDKLSFKGKLTPNSSYGIGKFNTNRRCVLSGNIMSLLFGDNFEGKTDLTGYDYAFYNLFYGNSYIIHASDLLLPATTLASSCYNYMFYNCTSLTAAPALPATTLADRCYQYMFSYCTSLTTAPALPATTLENSCYYYMFYNCTGLTIAPVLPATTLTEECYYSMFSGCKSLTTAPALPATKLASNCYCEMFYGCSGLTTAPALPATTLADSCYSNMFRNCSSLTTAPALPATTLASSCYSSMFSSCGSLTVAPELPATTLTDYCYSSMFNSCASLTEGPVLPATKLAESCYYNMFSYCSKLTTAPELPSTTLADWCYGRMFYNCSSLTTAPALFATTLVDCCYNGMFYGCSKLNNITMLATDISADSCLYNWVYGVASSGTFTKHPSMTSLPSGVNGIPTGWTVEDDITITSCKSLSITANDVSCHATTTTIYWTAICEGEINGEIIEITKTGIAISESFEQNLTDSAIERTISFTYMGLTATTTITHKFMPTNFQNYFSIKNTGNNPLSVQLKKSSAIPINYIKYGDGDWTTSSEAISIGVGEEVYFKGNLKSDSSYGIGTFNFTGNTTCSVQGNVMSLLFGDDFEGKTDLSGYGYAFYKLFYSNSTLTDASNLLLPATKLINSCYRQMFYCSYSLLYAPELPATTLADWCYGHMFSNCRAMLQPPSLPATELAVSCYECMFNNCHAFNDVSGLELPADVMRERCYFGMFEDCPNLTRGTELPAMSLASSCYRGMYYNCQKLQIGPSILPATTLAYECYKWIFYNCYELIVAPELPAEKLAESCYYYLFYGCKKLNNITMLATDISASGCLTNWVYGVSSSGTFTKHINMNSLPSGVNGIPTGWTVEDNITITSCKSLSITANDVSCHATTTTIYWTAICEGEINGEVVEVTKTGVTTSESFEQNSTDSAIERTISFTYMGVTATTTIIQQEYVAFYCNIVLNNQWQLSNTISNPDSAQYEGVYESFSNKGINNSASVMYVDIFGLTDFTLYIRSYAESSYDYVMVSQIDQTINSGTSYSNTTLIKSHTCGNQNSNTTINGYTKVDFTNLDGGEHRITILYRKDSSSHQGDDRGYMLIPKSYNPFVIN